MREEINWNIYWKSSRNRIYFWLTIGGLFVMFVSMFFTLAYTESRPGEFMDEGIDPWLGTPQDFSLPIFIFTYGSIVFAIATNVMKPVAFMQLLTAYILMQLIRCVIMFCVPLEPPAGILPLNDPLLESSFYNGRENLKDLFFSGHVATIAIVALCARNKWVRVCFWIIAAITAFMLAQQRVHYIIDVVSAPLFAWVAVKLADVISRPAFSSSS